MTIEEIWKYADKGTYNGVTINNKDASIIVGFFEHNRLHSEQYKGNKWNFRETSTNKIIELNGEDIIKIEIN